MSLREAAEAAEKALCAWYSGECYCHEEHKANRPCVGCVTKAALAALRSALAAEPTVRDLVIERKYLAVAKAWDEERRLGPKVEAALMDHYGATRLTSINGAFDQWGRHAHEIARRALGMTPESEGGGK